MSMKGRDRSTPKVSGVLRFLAWVRYLSVHRGVAGVSQTDQSAPQPGERAAVVERRTILSAFSSILMAVGLCSGYGAFAAVVARFLYPRRARDSNWMFVKVAAEFPVGSSVVFQAPAGQQIAVARLGKGESPSDFIALSDVCPHLGCRVHWEGSNERFFCPCHNGAFDATGTPIAGPPKDSGRSLSRYPLKIKRGLLFIEVPTSLIPGTGEDRSAQG